MVRPPDIVSDHPPAAPSGAFSGTAAWGSAAPRMVKDRLRSLKQRLHGPHPGFPVLRPLDTNGVEVLADAEFQRSCRAIDGLTLLDTPRLANLWSLCRLCNPAGHIVEIGSYKGGGALHLSNSCPERKVIVCDSFKGFERLDPTLDRNFRADQFKDTRQEDVAKLFRDRGRNFQVIAGFFPQSCGGIPLGPVSFVHLDADTYKSTIESLEFLAGSLMERSLIVLDDYFRKAEGVNEAVRQFTAGNRSWIALPLFPGQGLMLHRSWFES